MGTLGKIKDIINTPFTATKNFCLPLVNKLNNYLDKLFPQEKWNWKKIAIFWALLQALVISVLEIIIAYKNVKQNTFIREKAQDMILLKVLRETSTANPLTVYHMIFIVAQSYQAYLIVDTITKSSTIQLFAVAIFNFACCAYTIIQYQQMENIIEKPKDDDGDDNIYYIYLLHNEQFHTGKNIEIATIITMIVFCLGWAIIILRLYKVFGWNVFKQLGADIGVRNRLKLYQILLTLLKIDIFFFAGFSMQFLVFVIAYIVEDSKVIKIIHFVFLLLIFVMPFCGFSATKRENYHLMTVFIFTLSISIGYMVYNMVDILMDVKKEKYRNCKRSLGFACVSSIVLGVFTFILALTNFRNFPKGLKKNKTSVTSNTTENVVNSYGTPKRWSIE